MAVPKLKLGVLDTSHRLPGQGVSAALRLSLTLAARADDAGYSRYWLAEHHQPEHAQSSPEVLLPLIASLTSRIRVGTAGVLLAFHSPYRIAQCFRLLETLFPGRIDLGLARGSLGPQTAQALLAGRAPALDPEPYAEQVSELLGWLRGTGPIPLAPHRGVPEPWVLGHSGAISQLAALEGTAFCLGIFLRHASADGRILQAYRDAFRPSAQVAVPTCNIAVAGACAETEREARQAAAVAEQAGLVVNVVGTIDQCHEQCLELAARYNVGEVIFRDVSLSADAKLRTFDLLSQAFSLADQ